MKIPIEKVALKPELWPRLSIREELVECYMQVMANDEMKPIVLQKGTSVLIDGFHRIEAAKKLDHKEINYIYEDVEDKELFITACQLNSRHGAYLSKDERNMAIVKLYREGKEGS